MHCALLLKKLLMFQPNETVDKGKDPENKGPVEQ